MEPFIPRCPWYVAGPLLGLLVVGMFAVVNRPLGASGGFIDLVAFIRDRRRGISWTVYFLAGIMLGGLLQALLSGGLSASTDYGRFDERFGTTFATRALVLLVGGAVMGFGIRTAGGCTSGHGICGTSIGSRASWVSTAVFMGTGVASAHLIAWIMGGRS